MSPAIYVPNAPEISIKDGVACLKATSGDETLCWHLPLYAFRLTLARAHQTLAEHDAAGEIVPFDPKSAGELVTKKTRRKDNP